jgi:hypothetical protein
MKTQNRRESGSADTSVVLKLLGLAVVVAVVTCCNRWVKKSVMQQNGYIAVDPDAPEAEEDDEGRGFVVRGGELR